jgi:MFS family permease
MKPVLPIIVISQFFCTSLWFAGNAIMPDLVQRMAIDPGFLAHITSAVQFGFIAGTLLFAILSIADRFSPSLVFCCCAVVAAICNLGIALSNINAIELLIIRFLTGFFLAGIYPVGMKIAADYYQKGLGKSLGFLVGALVLGTSLPHAIKSFTLYLPWQNVIYLTSALSVIGGICIGRFVPNGPYRKAGQKINFAGFLSGFSNKSFRAAAFGYFGHMWELYAFWAFVPIILSNYQRRYTSVHLNIPLISFMLIGAGSIACFFSGWLSAYFGAKKPAMVALFLSGTCCLLSPFFLFNESVWLFLLFLFFWGQVVIADSPMFSTLVAQNTKEESRGTALTIVNCIGFSITIFSIQLLHLLGPSVNNRYLFMLLSIGPILGLWSLLNQKEIKTVL